MFASLKMIAGEAPRSLAPQSKCGEDLGGVGHVERGDAPLRDSSKTSRASAKAAALTWAPGPGISTWM